VLAWEGERLVGYAHLTTYGERHERRTSCEFVVDPAERRRGVGRRLLATAIDEARAGESSQIDVWAYNDTGTGGRMAAEFGFAPTRRLLHLHRHMRAVGRVAPPEGANIRSFVTGADEERWLELNRRIFAAHPENGQWTEEDLRARMSQPWFNADDFLLLDVDGALAGFCWLKVEERAGEGCVGEIYVIGAAPEQRGRGFGRYLLAAGLERLREREADIAAIYVDESNEAAVKLYQSAGFHYHHVDVCYSLQLTSARQLVGGVAA
jgi:mycothiol synthase